MPVLFPLWLIGQILASTWTLLLDGLSPTPKAHPAIVTYPLRVSKDWDIFWFTTAITMTPGTMSVGIEDGVLSVHAIFGADPEEVRASLAEMEERLAPEVAG